MDGNWRNTVVVVVSEFGRTFRENGNRGTDHGHGSVYCAYSGERDRSFRSIVTAAHEVVLHG
jgi:hypothetical protein